MHHYHVLMSQGFTVTKMMALIAIIAIVAAIAIPKLINMSSPHNTTTLSALTNALSAANKNNYTIRKMDSSLGKSVRNCADVANVLQGGLPLGYAIQSNRIPENTTKSCTLTGPSSTVATFKATGII